MRRFIFIVAILVLVTCPLVARMSAQVNVTQKNNNLSRNGLYIDPAFTPGNAANLIRDVNFDGAVVGNVHAQPLYVEGGPNGAMIIVVTASNNVYALNATTGTIIWQRNVGTPVTSGLCGAPINPFGIIGTPVVDLTSRRLFFNAMIDGATKKHFLFSLNVDTGDINPGWPVDLNATVSYNGIPFTSRIENERGALALVNGIVYVPFSGHLGDCDAYHGWVVGVQANNPSDVMGWATTAIGGGIWGHSGVASDGIHMFVITGNTFNTGGNWMGGEAIIRLQAGPIFSGQPSDYWAPTNWFSLDQGDTDLGGVSAMLINVPGANPSQLVLALGKDGNAYLLDRNNLGGIGQPVASIAVGGAVRGQSSATYTTSQGTYFVFRLGSSTLKTYRITPTTPPTIISAWSVNQNGQGSPWVTTTNGTNNAIVWVVGAQGDGQLHGYDGDTGAVIYAGGDVISGTRKWNSGIVARGSIYVANDNKVYAFRVPGATPTPTPTPIPRGGRAVVADFNGDGHPDWVARNVTTRQTALVYLNDNIVIGAALGPTIATNLALSGAADFNVDTRPDYALFAPNTFQTRIWYLSGPTHIGTASGPTLPAGWELVTTADFNGENKPDFVIFKRSTRQTAIVYLNNNVVIGAALLPTLPAGWNLAAVADFNSDGHVDIALFNSATRQTVIGYLSGGTLIGAALGPMLPMNWQLVAAADFNGDGHPDYLLYRPDTRQTAIWHLNNNVFIDAVFGLTLPSGWTLLSH
jgi:FG-GAP-like repeat/PQQ enzyme repeat